MYGNAKMWKKSYILILKKIYWWVFLSEVCRSIKTSFFSLLIFLLKSKAVFVKGVSTMLWQQWVSGIEPKGKNQISTPLVRNQYQSFTILGLYPVSSSPTRTKKNLECRFACYYPNGSLNCCFFVGIPV